MSEELSPKRREILVQLESLIGNRFYNPSMRNYAAGGARLPDGREFRYPIAFSDESGESKVYRDHLISDAVPDEVFKDGKYKVGVNRLYIIEGLNDVLDYLVEHHGLKID